MLGSTYNIPAIMVADAKLYTSDYVYPQMMSYGQRVDAPASPSTGVIKKGTLVTITEVHGIMAQLSSGSWVLLSAVQKHSTTPPSGIPAGDLPGSTPGSTTPGSTPDQPKTPTLPTNAQSATTYAALLKPRNLAIGVGVLALLIILLRHR